MRVNERAKPCTPFDESQPFSRCNIVRGKGKITLRRVICRLALHKRQLPRKRRPRSREVSRLRARRTGVEEVSVAEDRSDGSFVKMQIYSKHFVPSV